MKGYEASGLGAAIDAAIAAGLHPDFPTAVRAMTHLRDTFEPEAKTHARYDELYYGVYEQIYCGPAAVSRGCDQAKGAEKSRR